MNERVNPYEPASPDSTALRGASRWRRRFVILNLLLWGVPCLLLLIGFVSLALEMARESQANGGDPVTIQHSYFEYTGPSVSLLLAYVVLPNVLMFSCLMASRLRKR